MSALHLALLAKAFGVRFAYNRDRLAAVDLRVLPPNLRIEVEHRLGDILAVVAEQSTPCDVRASDVIDAARKVALRARRVVPHA